MASTREIPVHVSDRNPGSIARGLANCQQLPHVESIDFGLMDFVSAHHGAIPDSAMRSPGQFTHPLVVRAKCEIAAAALANGIVPAHNVTTELRDTAVVLEDARRARNDFGFLRMWSIHPAQIQPIVEAMRPDFAAVSEAANSCWQLKPLPGGRSPGKASCMIARLTDITGSCCNAHATGVPMTTETAQHFFEPSH
jgi:citrate lyase subunit beta/citryl-CoA lyase